MNILEKVVFDVIDWDVLGEIGPYTSEECYNDKSFIQLFPYFTKFAHSSELAHVNQQSEIAS